MRAGKIFAAFLVLAFFSMLASADWVEWLTVKVVDASYKPAPDVEVVVKYQKNDYAKRDATETGYTDNGGEYTVLLRNSVPEIYEDEFYTVDINPGYENVEERRVRFGDNRIGNAHLEIFTLKTTLYDLQVNFTDQKGMRLAGGKIRVAPSDYERITDEKGTVLFRLPGGRYTLTAEHGNFVTSASVAVANNTGLAMSVFVYNTTANIFAEDEKGNPIPNATVTFECPSENPCIMGQTKVYVMTDEKGRATMREILANQTNVTVEHTGVTRSRVIPLTTVDEVNEVFVMPADPLAASNISISSTKQPCRVVVAAKIQDERDANASITASLMYSIDGGEWLVANSKIENATHIFEISNCTPPFGMNYTLSASDALGSYQSEKFEFFMTEIIPVIPDVGENNTSEVQKPWWDVLNIPVDINVVGALFTLLGSIILLSFVVISTFIYREKISSLFRGNIFHRISRRVEAAEHEYSAEKEETGHLKGSMEAMKPSEMPDEGIERRIEEARLRAAKITAEAKKEAQAKAAPQKPEAKPEQPQQEQKQAPQQTGPSEQPAQQASPPPQQSQPSQEQAPPQSSEGYTAAKKPVLLKDLLREHEEKKKAEQESGSETGGAGSEGEKKE